MVISGLANPSTLAANYPSTSFAIYTTTADLHLIDGISEGVEASPDLTGENVSIRTVTVDDKYVQANTNVSLTFAPGTALVKTATFILTFPERFARKSDLESKCYRVSRRTTRVSCSYEMHATDEQFIHRVTIEGGCQSSGCHAETFLQFRIPIKNRGDTWPATLT